MQVAKHYRESWFSTFLQKVGMIDLSTYPPLAHQLVALIPMPIEISYSLLTIIFYVLLSFFSAKFVTSYLKIKNKFWLTYFLVLFTPALLITTFTFGQFTTLVGLTFSFISLYYFSEFLDKGREKSLLLASFSLILTAYSHLLSFLILTIFYLFILLFRLKFVIKNLKLTLSCFLLSFILIFPLYYPFFQKSVIQKEIPHWSRYPFKDESNTKRFVNMYGITFPISFFLPFMIISLEKNKRRRAIEIYVLGLTFLILSLGTTIPFVKIFGSVAYWLVYERFLLTSSIIFISLFSALLPELWIILNKKKIPIYAVLPILWVIISYKTLLYTHSLFFQDPIKTHDKSVRLQSTSFILDFLNNIDGEYRYQTFGYGRPIGEIYFYSKMPTLDTDYFTGRTIQWIRELGVDEIDQVRDKELLNIFVDYATNYSVKYAITFDDFYFNYFRHRGWKLLTQRDFGGKKVAIWENPENLKEIAFEKEKYGLLNYLRGTLPLALLITFVFFLIRSKLQKLK